MTVGIVDARRAHNVPKLALVIILYTFNIHILSFCL